MLIQLTPNQINSIQAIHKTPYQSMIQPILVQYKKLALSVNSTVHTSPIFAYGSASDPPSQTKSSSSKSVTPKRNPKPRDNTPDPVFYVTNDPDLDPSSSSCFL